MTPQRNPILWLVRWTEPNGSKGQWQQLGRHPGEVVAWLIGQRPYLFTAELFRQITVTAESRVSQPRQRTGECETVQTASIPGAPYWFVLPMGDEPMAESPLTELLAR